LDDYVRLIEEFGAGRVAVVGTSAMRDATGGEELAAYIRAKFGADVRILSGEQEARLTFRGAVSGLAIDRGRDMTVFDIGGGSTEIVIGRLVDGAPVISFAKSFDVGSVRLTERHVSHDPPLASEIHAIEQTLRQTFAGLPPSEGAAPIGVAGTMTTLASVSLSLTPYDGARVHGHSMRLEEIRDLVTRLSTMTLESRRRLEGMEPKRADVIVAGGLIAVALLERWGVGTVVVSDRGVRWGLAEELSDLGTKIP
jgi:exopolyphosphatase/guanosine-5'-triphosphate,3'-diphosphate pyrophosphatase